MDEGQPLAVTIEIFGPVTLALVDALAQLNLTVRRGGGSSRVLDPVPELCELVHLVGLGDALGPLVLRDESGRESEIGEPLRVEEVVDGGDLPA